MADLTQSLIQIKRSQGAAAPSMLRPGELAYSTDESSGKKLGVMYIGGVATDSNGYSVDMHIIGGKKYTTLLEGEAGKVTAGKAIIVGANGEVDQLAVGSLQGVVTNTASGEKTLVIGDGKTTTVIHDPYIAGAGENGTNVPMSEFVTQLVESGVELAAGAGIAAITKNESGAFVIGLAEVGTAGTYGSETKIPAITVNAYGQVTAVEEKTISTKLSVDSEQVDLVAGKLATADGVKSAKTAEGVVTVSVDDTVLRTTGGQTIAGSLNVTGQADFGVAPTVGEEVVLTDATVADALVYSSSVPTTDKLGGFDKGTTFDNMPVLQLIDELLHPYVGHNNPSITVTRTPADSYVETGTTVTVSKVAISWGDKGSKNVETVTLKNGSAVVATQTLDSRKSSHTFDGLSVSATATSNVSLKAEIFDGKKTFTSGATTVSFTRPFYYGIADVGTVLTSDVVKALANKKVLPKSSINGKAFQFTTNNQCAVMAYPSEHGKLKTAKGILDGNGFDVTSSFNLTEVNVDCLDGSSVKYYVYMNGAATMTMNYTFVF